MRTIPGVLALQGVPSAVSRERPGPWDFLHFDVEQPQISDGSVLAESAVAEEGRPSVRRCE